MELNSNELNNIDYLDEVLNDNLTYMDDDVNVFKNISRYFEEIVRIPLLTTEEEIALAKKIALGDKEARELLIISNLKLVISIAKRYIGNGIPLLDLIQDGSNGLIIAVDKYDINYGCKFSTYATYWIKQAVIRSIEEKSKNIKIPSCLHAKIKEYKRVYRVLEFELKRKPTLSEIADYMGITLIELSKICILMSDTISMNIIVGESEENELCDFIVSDDLNPEEEMISNTIKLEFHKILNESKLSEREKDILFSRYGFNGRCYKLTEIAARYNITKERVRQIEKNAIKKLKKNKKIRNFASFNDDYK